VREKITWNVKTRGTGGKLSKKKRYEISRSKRGNRGKTGREVTKVYRTMKNNYMMCKKPRRKKA